MTPIHVCAQALSLYLSGMPVSTSVEKLIMMKKCTQRWNGVNRRKWVRAPTAACATLGAGLEGYSLVANAAVDASHGGTFPPSGLGRST